MVPVHDGVIEADLDALSVAGIGQLLQDIALEGRGGNVEIRVLGIEQAEAVVMLGGDDDVFHTGAFCHPHPLVGIEPDRVELAHELVVLGKGDLGGCADPFGVIGPPLPLTGGDRIQAPVDEQAEARVAPPLHARIMLCGRFPLRKQRPGAHQEQKQENPEADLPALRHHDASLSTVRLYPHPTLNFGNPNVLLMNSLTRFGV
jgi:hypothetical protein